MATALVYSDKYLEHEPGRGHPERPERLRAVVNALKRSGCWSPKLKVLEPKPAKLEEIALAHDPEYIRLVERLGALERFIDGDTPARKNTFELALLAAGGATRAARAVMKGEVSNAFAMVRPPGHHASRAKGGGFCYFNNIAIMVKSLQSGLGVKRVFILDLDAHCGDGSEDIFYEDASVFYMSLHQDPRTLYPGTGFVEQVGAGEGEGYTVNVPLPPGSGDAEYASVMRELFSPLSEQFKPELIAVSMGFDAHADDPLTELELSTQAYGWLTRHVVEQAEKLCGGRVVLVLEGGYALDALAESSVNVVKVLMGERPPFPSQFSRPKVVEEIKQLLASYWKL